MPFDFVLIGIFLITSVFYLNKKDVKNIVIICAIFLLLIGYFFNGVCVANVRINLFNIVALITIVFVLIMLTKIKLKALILQTSIVVICYLIFNLISVDFNLFFDVKPLIVITTLVTLLFDLNLYGGVINIILSLSLCEIINVIIMLPKLKFIAIFSRDLILCIVLSCVVEIVVYYLLKLIKRKNYEKVS